MKGATIAAATVVWAAGLAAVPSAAADDAPAAAGPDDEAAAGAWERETPDPPSTIGFGVGMGVSQFFEVDAINRRLTRAGFDELSDVGAHVSLAVPLTIDRFVVLTQLRIAHFGGPNDTSTFDSYLGTLSFGYSLTPPEVVALYPFAGLGVGAADLTVGGPGPAAGSFDDGLTGQTGGLDLSSLSFIGTVGIGADLQIARAESHPTRGLFLGARTGFTAGFVHSDWSLGPAEGDLVDGPPPPTSGFHGELAFGLRF